MGFVERFKSAGTVDTLIEVPIAFNQEIEGVEYVDVFTLKIARFSPSEMEAAAQRARIELVKEGIDVTSLGDKMPLEVMKLLGERAMVNLCDMLKDHVKGWKHEPPEGERAAKFTPENLEAVWGKLNNGQRFLVGALYRSGLEKDATEKKSTRKKSGKGSRKNSNNGSGMTSSIQTSTAGGVTA